VKGLTFVFKINLSKTCTKYKGLNGFYPLAIWTSFGLPPCEKKTWRFPLAIRRFFGFEPQWLMIRQIRWFGMLTV